jgi:hypothetical protein
MAFVRFLVFIIFILFLFSCVVKEKSVADIQRFVEFIGYELSIDEPYFLAKEKSKYYMLRPGSEDDVIRDFVGGPTVKSFLNGTWSKSNYEGSFKYIDVIPTGTTFRIVDVVEISSYGIGITYDYHAKIINNKKYNNIVVNVNSLIERKFRR